MSTFALDIKKTRRATPVNFIHSVESFIFFRLFLNVMNKEFLVNPSWLFFCSQKDSDAVHNICLAVLYEYFVKDYCFLYNILGASLSEADFKAFCSKIEGFRRPLPSVPKSIFKREC